MDNCPFIYKVRQLPLKDSKDLLSWQTIYRYRDHSV